LRCKQYRNKRTRFSFCKSQLFSQYHGKQRMHKSSEAVNDTRHKQHVYLFWQASVSAEQFHNSVSLHTSIRRITPTAPLFRLPTPKMQPRLIAGLHLSFRDLNRPVAYFTVGELFI
jgi:hypothetical protein